MDERERAMARSKPLPLQLKVGYAVGQMVDGVTAHSLGVFLLFYLTAICGLPGAMAGFALAAGMVVDAVLDPLIGSMSDSWKSKIGRRLPFMMVGLPLSALFFVLIFSVPAGMSVGPLFALVLVLSICLRLSLSIFNLPFLALTAELTEDYRERSSLSAWRWAMSMVGTLSALVLGFTVFFSGPQGTADRDAYTPFAFTLVAILALGGLISMWATWRMRDRAHLPAATEGNLHQRVFAEVRETLKNPSFAVLVGSALLFFTALGAHSSLSLHINTYFWGLDPDQIKVATLSTFVGLLFGAPLAGPILKRLEKRAVVMIGMTGLAISGCSPAALRLLGAFPFEDGQLTSILAVILFTGGVLMASAAIAYGAMMADATDEHEYLFGTRREALYYAGWNFAAKSANGLGALVAGIFIQISGFSTISEGSTAQVADGSSLFMLALLYSAGCGAIYAGSIWMLRKYQLNAARHKVIVETLNVRRMDAHGADARAA